MNTSGEVFQFSAVDPMVSGRDWTHQRGISGPQKDWAEDLADDCPSERETFLLCDNVHGAQDRHLSA